jgi:FKBP-type peptidyl-prolyl cis-trans isomerase 2
VAVHYAVRLAASQPGDPPFDSSQGDSGEPHGELGGGGEAEAPPFEFVVGGGGVIAGLERAVRRFHVGARVSVAVPSGLAYGPLGAGVGAVPPFADLAFDIELAGIRRPAPRVGMPPL